MNRRKQLIAKVHIAKAEMRLSNDDYRALLLGAVNKDSCAQMTVKELETVLAEMEAHGWANSHSPLPPHSPTPPPADTPTPKNKATSRQRQLIRQMWREGGAAGWVKAPTDKGLRHFIKRTCQVEGLEWLTVKQASDCIEALKAMKERVKGEG